jgi:hypothetical protein
MFRRPAPPEPIFVCGLGRSGTSWIARALGQSPELTYIEEAWLIAKLEELVKWFTMIHDQWEFTSWRRRGVDRRTFVEGVGRMYRELLVRAANDKRFVEKTPDWNALHIGFLHELFPDAYYVLIHRDGRNYVASLEAMKANEQQAFDFAASCLRWARMMDIFADVRSTRSIRRFTVIRYEDLLQDFDASFAELCRFAAIRPFQPKPHPPNTFFSEKHTAEDFTSRWHSWSAEKRLLFKQHAGRQLVAAGYVESNDAW